MIRFGALLVGLALAGTWIATATGGAFGARIAALAALVAGLALLLAGREPWPHCCEHCPTYAARRAAAMAAHPAGRARFGARAIVEAARAEAAQLDAQDPARAERG